jgi:hypothetical protein
MRAWLLLLLATIPLSACISTHSSPSPTIVVPQGASVVCPNGTAAVYSDGAYRC